MTCNIKDEVMISEAYAVGVFWNNPDNYNFYPKDKISVETFLNPHWGFFFGLGRYMHEKEVAKFDDITVAKYVNELRLESRYEDYGGFETVKEIMIEVKDKSENLDSYYADIKKYRLISSLVDLIGESVLKPNGKYDHRKMAKEQIFTYWVDKINKIGFDGDSKYDEHFLLEDLEQELESWDTNPDVGLDFYQSSKMTKICTGWDFGHVYMYGGFGGSGKSSLVLNKVVMSCIANKEKLLVIANEQSIQEFKKMLIITAMGLGTKDPIQRQRINEGNFTQAEREKT